MAGDTQITVVGNLVDDPELRFTPSGAAVANFRIASTPRTFDKQSNEWKDGEALFLPARCGGRPPRTSPSRSSRGMRVVVQGRLKQRSYETREGEKRTVFEIEVDEVGPSLKYATAKVTAPSARAARRRRRPAGRRSAQRGRDDPWATPPAGGAPQGGGSGGAPANDPWAPRASATTTAVLTSASRRPPDDHLRTPSEPPSGASRAH